MGCLTGRVGGTSLSRMKVLVMVLLLLGGGCSMATINGVALGAATATLACDWSETRWAAEQDWTRTGHELNPVLGPTPTTGQVDAYFASAIVVSAAIWHVLPERWRWAPSAVVAVAQARVLVRNEGGIRQRGGRAWRCGR